MSIKEKNAGFRLWQIQKAQGTGLCVGLDPHYGKDSPLDESFYLNFTHLGIRFGLWPLFGQLIGVTKSCLSLYRPKYDERITAFLTGLTAYFIIVVESAWANGIRVFKPQVAFYERFQPFGAIILEMLCKKLDDLSALSGEPHFKILDAKRGDIFSTQVPYYDAYLSGADQEVFPGVNGRFGFDAMTVVTWMGEDVLTPGLPHFNAGKGAIVVTRTSNPSGTTFQDACIVPNHEVELTEKQKSFQWCGSVEDVIGGRSPMVHEAVLEETTLFSSINGLDYDGVSPLFSVMGATVKMTDSFRKIRGPGAIALVPGFGAQGGAFDKIEALLVREGLLAGHWGILSSSRAHNYPWMKKYGGEGDPQLLPSEMERAIDSFRQAEKKAYESAGMDWPF